MKSWMDRAPARFKEPLLSHQTQDSPPQERVSEFGHEMVARTFDHPTLELPALYGAGSKRAVHIMVANFCLTRKEKE